MKLILIIIWHLFLLGFGFWAGCFYSLGIPKKPKDMSKEEYEYYKKL